MTSDNSLPKRTVANAFIIWRVPQNIPISKEMLLENIKKDITTAKENFDFSYKFYSRRERPYRTLKFLLQRHLLAEKSGLIFRNKRTNRYVARLPEEVVELIDGLPICDPLILLAGAGD